MIRNGAIGVLNLPYANALLEIPVRVIIIRQETLVKLFKKKYLKEPISPKDTIKELTIKNIAKIKYVAVFPISIRLSSVII